MFEMLDKGVDVLMEQMGAHRLAHEITTSSTETQTS
ncbi:MAG: hypothetical protein ACI8W1_000506 [Candidatus Azotimanducaceae bacterium]|jgi:hypothetical protein